MKDHQLLQGQFLEGSLHRSAIFANFCTTPNSKTDFFFSRTNACRNDQEKQIQEI